MKKPPFLNGHIYHIYNRGVEKRDIFMDDNDRMRFIMHLFAFNNDEPASNINRDTSQLFEVQPRTIDVFEKLKKKIGRRNLLVEIFVFELMPNHYHLMLRQLTDGGIVKFMQRLGTGYTMYFNTKYDRVGPLFQGGFKAVLLEKEAHFLYLPNYIHFNSLVLMPERGRTSLKEKMEFLENYKWSSFPDYIGKKNFPSVTQREFLRETIGGEKQYRKEAEEWLKEGDDFQNIKDILLDSE